jgi:HEAT repeat protein
VVFKLLRILFYRSKLTGPREADRSIAAEAIRKVGGQLAVDTLVRALAELESWSSDEVVGALVHLGPPAVPALIEALRHAAADPGAKGSENTRRSALRALGRIRDLRALGPLSEALRDPNALMRAEAVSALATLEDSQTVGPLIEALGDPYEKVRERAARALAKLGDVRAVDPMIRAMEAGRTEVAEALADLAGPRALFPLLRAKPVLHWRSLTLKHAARLGTAAVGPLVEALKDPDGEAREGAAQVLGKLRQEPAVEPLLAALRDGEANVRASAARALGRLADPRAVVPLIALLSDCDSRVRGTAAEVLGNLGDARAVEPLMAFVQNERGWVCQEAVKALRCLRDPRAVEALIAALGDTAAQTCTEAALALADLGEPAWRQWVTGDSTDYARLGRCGDPRALAPLVRALADDTIAQYAARALGEMGDPRAIEPLARALMSESKEVRAAAALALARFGDQRAIRPLIRTLCHDGLTRLAAAQALAGLGQPEWMQWVTGCSGDAVRLGASGHPLAIEPLLEGIQRDFCSDDREIIQVLAGLS